MASADLRYELTCSVCLNTYKHPVTLPCGHSFCRPCIVNVLDSQEGYGVYACPECRAQFQERPALKDNRKLQNIAKSFQSIFMGKRYTVIPCTYCIDSPVPAVKTCLTCEASLCHKHLGVHSKSADHTLMEPKTMNRKCSIHKKDVEYYCCEDAACICVSCSLAGEHRGHQVETLNEASEKKKEELRNILQKLTSEREEAEKRVQSLQELKRQVQGKAASITEQVTALIKDIREQLEALEKQVLSEISRQEEQVSLRVSDLIRQLEIQKEDLSMKMGHIEELCNMTDPLTVLQERESDRADCCDPEEEDNEDTERHDIKVHVVGDLDLGLISVTLLSGLTGIVTGVMRWRHVLEASDMLLDVNTASDMLLGVNTASDMLLVLYMASDMLLDINTAGNHVSVSGDLKTVSWSGINLNRPETPERFQNNQVLSSTSVFSGKHYWEVEGSESGWWSVGMAYASTARKGRLGKVSFGNSNKSWVLWVRVYNNQFSVKHDRKNVMLPHVISCCRLGIFLDYEAGRLSFYELCDPVRHIHTFTATFTEPLYFGFGLWHLSLRSTKNVSMVENGWVRIENRI